MKKMWKLDNKGMTLLEVIIAFAIFASAAVILIAGFNIAFKVIENSNEIKDKSQESAAELEMFEGIVPIPSTINLKVGNENFDVNGNYYTTSMQKNDGILITQTMFEAKKLEPPPSPSVPVEDEIPVIPKDVTQAYFNPDLDPLLGQGVYFTATGELNKEAFQSFLNVYGKNIKKGVVTNLIRIESPVVVGPNSNLEQLFFVPTENINIPTLSNISFEGLKNEITYCVKFMYLGREDIDQNSVVLDVQFREDGSVDKDNLAKLKLKSFDGSGTGDTVLYLPKLLKLKARVPEENTLPEGFVKSIEPGYYLVPSDTDLIKALYDEDLNDKFSKISENTYYRSFEQIKSELDRIGVIYE
ncbi:MAG: prepilin-type N-terminal cleavage/methylation domain-containing protein [Eubacterium sp.]